MLELLTFVSDWMRIQLMSLFLLCRLIISNRLEKNESDILDKICLYIKNYNLLQLWDKAKKRRIRLRNQ